MQNEEGKIRRFIISKRWKIKSKKNADNYQQPSKNNCWSKKKKLTNTRDKQRFSKKSNLTWFKNIQIERIVKKKIKSSVRASVENI